MAGEYSNKFGIHSSNQINNSEKNAEGIDLCRLFKVHTHVCYICRLASFECIALPKFMVFHHYFPEIWYHCRKIFKYLRGGCEFGGPHYDGTIQRFDQ